jgi:uncharacterized membrane protein (DUF373 family)
MSSPKSPDTQPRTWIARAFTIVEDVVYLGLGVLLAGIVLTLLVTGFISFGKSLMDESLGERVVKLLDRILLILLIVELLYTVQVSFREHALIPEPFLVVGLISAIRRVLVLTAEFGTSGPRPGDADLFVIELAVLTVLILALVICLVLLRKKGPGVVAERA